MAKIKEKAQNKAVSIKSVDVSVKVDEQNQNVSKTSNESDSKTKAEISKKEDEIRVVKEKIRLLTQKVLTGRSPIRVVEKDGEVKWECSYLREPFNELYDAIKYLTATTDPELAYEILEKGSRALPLKDRNALNINIAIQSLADSAPKDAIESKFCMQETALYAQGMQYLSRAENSDRVDHSEFYMRNAIKLLRLRNETIEALTRYHRGGKQCVVVQHVNIENGGQAIVGSVLNGGGGQQQKIGEVIP